MDKYSGMNKVQSRVAANDQIVNKKKPQGGGFLKTLFVQTLICLAIGAALFVGRFVDIKYHAAAAEKVKDAVCFDAFGYIAELFEKD